MTEAIICLIAVFVFYLFGIKHGKDKAENKQKEESIKANDEAKRIIDSVNNANIVKLDELRKKHKL